MPLLRLQHIVIFDKL